MIFFTSLVRTMNYNSSSEVLDFLEQYFKSRVKDPEYLKKLESIISLSRVENTVPIRSSHQIYINYTNEYNDYLPSDSFMREVWKNLLDLWQ